VHTLHRDVVAPEDGARRGVVFDPGVARRQHALERALDPDLERVEAQHRGHGHVRRHDRERVTREPPREGVHGRADYSPVPPPRQACIARTPGSKVRGLSTEEVPVRRIAALVLVLALVAGARAVLSPELDHALRDAKYVYIQSERKAGALGKAAEIWFYYDGKAVYVGTPPTSWRVRRI